ncbi:MAG: molybdopterin-dependent oxidoreductase, partial [Planctomycetes bacterium]|nr:molybdopterin-dependent oxidoreductase [Planctomycetota bacterium]
DGTVVVTNSEKVKENRRAVEEYLLLDHPVDCPICDRAGECYLQDYYYEHGRGERRDLPQPFSSRHKDLGPEVTLFVDRCVMCSRCVRFTREISGTGELQVVNRGNHAEIDVFPGFPIDNKLSGNVVDLCPVGALCSRDFLYKQRVWFLQSHRSVCAGCSSGCSISIQGNHGTIYRLKPRHNPNANDWWMCDEGRLGYQYISSPDRLTTPQRRTGGALHDAEWPELIAALRSDLTETVRRHGGRGLVGVLSPMLGCEEAYLLAKYLKSLAPDVRLALGRVPVVGTDDAYPKTRGIPPATPKFVIHAEKCPNRRGIEGLLMYLERGIMSFDAVLSEVNSGSVKAVLLTGGYPAPWLAPPEIDTLTKPELVVLVDILGSAATENADYVLPGAAWAEKDGSYVNCEGLLQASERAVRPPGQARAEGRIFWEMAGRPRLYHAGDVLRELAAEVPYFADCAEAEVPEHGVRLAWGEL